MAADLALIRESSPADAPALSAIEQQLAFKPWSLSQFISACRAEDTRVRVAQGDDAVVLGFAIFSEVLGEATLLNIAVHPRWQGRGLGGQLLRAVLAELRAMGVQRMVLEVRASNASAIALYQQSGFAEDGVRANYYPAPQGREDALLMSLDLAD